jgi:basic amino acid/polyamine antiporter, APA family
MTRANGTLPRRLTFGGALAVVIGSMIGSGIFRSPAAIAQRVPAPGALMAVWIAGGLLALCGALTLAEVTTALPRTGGIYVIVREGWGRLPAFLFGWAEVVIIRAAALGAVATTFAEYTLRTLGYDPRIAPYDSIVHYVAAVAIVLLAALNITGVRLSALLLEVASVAKAGALLLIALGAVWLAPALAHPQPLSGAPVASIASVTPSAVGLALVAVLWAYDGWADLSFVAGEVVNPDRTLPRALIGGTLAVLGIYCAANLAYLAVLPVSRISASALVAADVADQLVGHWGVVVVGIVVVFATVSTLNGSLLTCPRIFFAMADDGMLFRPVAAVHPRYQTPYVAIALAAGLGVAFVLARTFEQLADTFILAIVPFYALAVGAVFPLRRRAGYRPSFRLPGYPVVPALFVLTATGVVGSAIVDPASRWPTAAVIGVILAGIPVFYYARGKAGPEIAAEAQG